MIFASLLLSASPSPPTEPPRVVEVEVVGCERLSPERLEPQLELELPPPARLAGDGTDDESVLRTRVEVGCTDERFALHLVDGYTGKSMRRELVLEEGLSQGGVTRTLALSIAEFVQASWLELSLDPVEQVQSVEAPAEPDDAPAEQDPEVPIADVQPADSPWQLQLDLLGWSDSMRLEAQPSVFGGAGLGIGVAHRARTRFEWGAGAELHMSTRSFGAGRVLVSTPSVRATVGFAQRRGPLSYQLGAIVRAGAAQVQGRGGTQGRESAGFRAPRVSPGAFVQIGGQIGEGASHLGLRLEAGAELLPIRIFDADDALLTTLAGARVGAGVFWRFDLAKSRGTAPRA